MAKILIILSVVLLLGAGVLGFLNKGKIDEAKAELQSAQELIEEARNEKENVAEAVQEAKDAAEAEAAKRAQAEEEAQTARQRLSEVETKVGELESTIQEKEAQIATLKESQQEVPQQPVDDGKITELEAKVAELETSLVAAEEEKKILTEKVESAQASAEALREAEEQRQARLMTKSLEGQVLAYNPAWNFVVLNLGDRNGVINNAEMLVKRGGQMIGRVKITSVEPTTSIADVLPSTLRAGTQIQPGDRVIVPAGS